ncbi:MAG TPA: glycosyltransferase family 2 protein [Rhodanobacteraceae bacterium]|nr:glycosyltransferase family 2 protein [Rhodanobacteraceae bacterium]
MAVVMISLNEGHNMGAVLENLRGWAREVFLVDSFSTDDTVDVALRHGVHVVQRRFRGFGDQWNFALRELPITASWTMKLDPDERLTDLLKQQLATAISADDADGFSVMRRLWFMGQSLSVKHSLVRVWRSGRCRFTDVDVNEHPIVEGRVRQLDGEIEHHDSPSLEHWLAKQNNYTSAEAVTRFEGGALAAHPRLLGNSLERRMWLKRNFWKVPGRYTILFLYHLLAKGAWRAGRVGWIWARLRTEVYRLCEYKTYEMRRLGRVPPAIPSQPGHPDPRVPQYD